MKLQVQTFDCFTDSRVGETFYIDVKDQSDALTSIKAILALRDGVSENVNWLFYFDFGDLINGEFVPWKIDDIVYDRKFKGRNATTTFLDILKWNNLEEYHASLRFD